MKGVHDLQIFHKKLAHQSIEPNLQLEKNKSSIDNSNDEGDHNPPKGSLEKTHKLPINNKRKRKINQEVTNEVEPEDEISLEDMDMDANIEDIEFPYDEQRV
jgi:hypothetical protein